MKPKRAHRSDWWAPWQGAVHAICHVKYINWKTLEYFDGTPNKPKPLPNTRWGKVHALLAKTKIALIQKDGEKNNGRSFAGWHGWCEITDLKLDDDAVYFKIGTYHRFT